MKNRLSSLDAPSRPVDPWRSTIGRSTRALLGSLLFAALLPAAARAQSVRVELGGCSPELGASVEAALAVELEGTAPEARRRLLDGAARCAIECEESAITAVVVGDGARAEQRIDAGVPGLARRLAVALAELLDASSGAPPETSIEASDAPREEAPDASVEPTPDPVQVRLRAAAGLYLGGEPLLPLGAFELGVEIAPTSNVAIVLAAAGALGALDVAAGHLDVRLASLAASLRLGGPLDRIWLGAGPAARGGLVSWTGTPGRDALGGWLGLGAVLVGHVSLGDVSLDDVARLGLEVEGGPIAVYSGVRVSGAGEDVARVGGGWVELRLAFDVALD